MLGNADVGVNCMVTKIGDHRGHLSIAMAQVGVVATRVQTILVDIHQVKELAASQRWLAIAQAQDFAVLRTHSTLGGCGMALVPAAHGGDAPVVKNGGAAVVPAITLGIGGGLAQFLTGIEHKRAL